MDHNNTDKLGADILEGLELSDDGIDLYDDDFNSVLMDLNSPSDLFLEPMIVSGESYPIFDPVQSSSNTIPTNPKEWMVTDQTSKRLRPPRLFEFLILLLQKPHYVSYASYINQSQGIFQIHKPDMVADLWQQVKNRQSHQNMTYDKFARAIRWYYQSDIMKKTNTRYTFQFSPATLKEFIVDENNNSTTDFYYVKH